MTEVTSVATTNDQLWWTALLSRRAEAGLPLFRRRSTVYRRKSAHVTQDLPPALAERLAPESPDRRHALLLAATAGVLWRYRGDVEPADIVVGSPLPAAVADERTDVLPVPVPVSPGQSWPALTEAAAEAVAAAAAHPDVSADELLDALGVDEVLNRNPLFPVALRVDGHHPPFPPLRSDVTVTVHPGALDLEYNANVLDERTVARFGQHVATFLSAGLAEPDLEVCSVGYLRADERAHLLESWSGAPASPPEGALHDLVREVARSHPDREAIVFGDRTISYGELETLVNRLANHLRARGAGVGTRVGLCLPASADLLIGALSILRSGAAVMPLVPTFPLPRNLMAVADAGMDILVTDSALGAPYADAVGTVVAVDTDADDIARAPSTDPGVGVRAEDPLYVLFTSGSTGRPKGVVMAHGTLVNLVQWQRRRGLDPAGRRTLQRTSIGFDVSFQEIFATLGFGGCLVVAPDTVRDDVSLLPEFVERHGITRMFLPPVALDQIAVTAALDQRTMPTLREIIVAGEQLHVSMPIRRIFHQLDCTLDNQYGPTETHVATAYALDGTSTRWPEAPPIGRPVSNARVYVLDAWGQPVPAGVPGELHIGGVAPALGYLSDDQTAQRFRTDPFVGDGRTYATGDRVRFLADGDLEFLGRRDEQVKIRGYRIELGEIEANLLRIAGIRQAAVTVHESEGRGRQLAAYVVADGETDPASIRQQLLDVLPGHMVPATSNIVRMAALPLTPTGKVHRRALPPPAAGTPTGGAQAVGDTERTVAKIWAKALGLERVGRDDSFIELGGHSLVGIQVVAQLNEMYTVALPLRSLLSGTTVAATAAEIEALRRAREGVPAADATVTEATPAEQSVEAAPPELRELTLPNGRRIACTHPAETRYLYLDVFEHRTYDRGGIRYPATGTVFDVGAHVGLFTLYVRERSPGLRVFAFEPAPPLFEALRRNTAELGGVRLFPFALGASGDTAQLTYYPNLTGMSSFHPNEAEERALLTGILHNLGTAAETSGGALLAESAGYLDERLVATTFTAHRRTLSDVLAETGVDRIDLLKIDVQKAELEVLAGIAPGDWTKIRQLAIELHDRDGELDRLRGLLTERGYRVTVDQDPLHAGTVVHLLYAVRE